MDQRIKTSRRRPDIPNGREPMGNYRSVPRQRRKKKRRRTAVRLVPCLFLIAAAALYLTIGLRYEDTFLPNTSINGVISSGMTLEEVKAKIDDGISRYVLVLEERGGVEEKICGRDIGLHLADDESLKQILEGQNLLLWGFQSLKKKEYRQECMVAFNPEQLKSAVSALECLNPDRIAEPSGAYLAYTEESGLQIIPEQPGNSPMADRLMEEIEKAVLSLTGRISLEALDLYKKPEILSDDPGLVSRRDAWKPYTDVTVTYRFGSRSEVLDGTRIYGWLTEDSGGNVDVDPSKAEEFVKELAQKYNTAYCAKELKTSYGKTVTITKGHYGWMIDKQAETNALMEIIRSGKSQEREPVYLQKAASHDGPDYGDTYVEINLTAQHLFYYNGGSLLIESDFVSGNESKGWSTPAGAYELTYKQRDAVLKGKNYNTPVTYWMPFNGNIGMHDGYWRTSFGGTIYKKNGSHGCINLPPSVAKTIYSSIEAGIPVLCYHLEGTETDKTTDISSGKANASSSKENKAAEPQKQVETQPEPQTEKEAGKQSEPRTEKEAGKQPEPQKEEQTELQPDTQPEATGQKTDISQEGPGFGKPEDHSGPTGQPIANVPENPAGSAGPASVQTIAPGP